MKHAIWFVVLILSLAQISATGNAAAILSNLKLPQTSVSNGLSETSLGNYRAIEPKTLDDLPPQIRAKLTAHLVDRLGEQYFARLKLAGGQIVDIDEMHRVDPDTKDFRWTVFAYRLVFVLSFPDKGLSQYFAVIELDKNGDVMKGMDIELPPVRRVPSKADVIFLSKAYAIAARLGQDPTKTTASVGYNRDVESIVYELSMTIKDDGIGGTDRAIEIDAHSGRVLSDEPHEWIR